MNRTKTFFAPHLFLIILFAGLLCVTCVIDSLVDIPLADGVWNGLKVEDAAGSVLENYRGRENVLKLVPQSADSPAPLRYYLDEFKGKKITVSLSMFVRVNAPAAVLWQTYSGGDIVSVAGSHDMLPASSATDPWIMVAAKNVPVSVPDNGQRPFLWLENLNGLKGGEIFIADIIVDIQLYVEQPVVPVTGISLDRERTLAVGGSGQLQAVVLPPDATDKRITWSSSDPAVVEVSASGWIIAKSVGNEPVIVTAAASNGVNGICVVRVNPVAASGIVVSPKPLTLGIGGTEQLSAEISPANATDQQITWSSGNEAVAAVSGSGLVTAKAFGSAAVTATAGNGVFDICLVTVSPTVVTSVIISPPALSLVVGGAGELRATVEPDNASIKTLIWASDNPDVAAVSANGLVTAKGVGTAVVTARAASGGKTASCAVTVTPLAVTGVEIVPKSLTLYARKLGQLSARVVPPDATNQTVTWSSSNPAVADVSDDGWVVAKSVGTAIVTVTTQDGGFMDSCTVNVEKEPDIVVPVSSVTVSPDLLTLVVGGAGELKATVEPANATDKTVIWSSGDEKIAVVSAGGVVTAKGVGMAVITATANGAPGGMCYVTVEPVVVTGIAVSPKTVTLNVNASRSLSAAVSPNNATNKNVTWSSSNTAIADVSAAGLVTARGVGTAVVTATASGAAAGKTVTDTCTVTVNPIAVTGVAISPKPLTLTLGSTGQLSAAVSPDNATNKSVTWKSGNTAVAEVSAAGLVTTKSVGTAVITVTTESGSRTDTCTVTVTPVEVTGVALNKTAASLVVGTSETLTATVSPANATDKRVTWKSSNTAVADVSAAGLVTAKSVGTADITVVSTSGGKTAVCTVTVTPVAVTGVTLNKTTTTLTVGATETLNATVAPSNATNKNVTWTSGNTAVADVSAAGLVTAKTAGTATITVTTQDGGKTANCTVTVSGGSGGTVAVTSVTLNKTSATLTIGAREKLAATVTPTDAANKTVTWSSTSPGTVKVTADGTIVAIKEGEATITATTQDGGKTTACTVTATLTGQVSIDSLPPLKDTLRDYLGGNAVIGNIFTSGNTYNLSNSRLSRHFSIVTPENEMKPNALSYGKNSYNYGTADNMVNAARNAGLAVHAHTLIWHSQIPQWMKDEAKASKESALTDMRKYIADVAGHFKGKVASWDVVNEAFPDNVGYGADWKTSMRKGASGEGQDANPWFVAIGSDFIYEAFLAARNADPDAKLYYNDYNMDQRAKATAVCNMVRDVNEAYRQNFPTAGRLLIEGIGMQGHYNTGTSIANVKTAIDDFVKLGVEIAVSELDVLAQSWGDYDGNKALVSQGFMDQAQRYAQLFQLYRNYPNNIKRITFWGVSDSQSWRSRGKPLLFDENYRAKPAYYAAATPQLYLEDH